MMLWNQKYLPQPPINTYKSVTQDIDLTKLRNALQNGIKHFKEDEFLGSEAAILSRILYRMKMKFRCSKDFKLMERLKRCLDIYFSSKMARHLQNILDMTPRKYERETYLPTRNMLCFILVKLQGLVKLMERIHDMCLIVATELNSRLYIGHFWKQFLILFALISRISILVKFNTKFLCELYGKLLPHSYKFENTGLDWLPEGYVLPRDLRTWLSVEWVYEEEFVDLTAEPSNEVVNFFNLIDDDDDDDVQFCDEYILLDDEDKQIINSFKQLSPIKETLIRNRMRGFSINEDDLGEEITDIIELNDTIPEAPQEALINTPHKSVHMEDIGDEIASLTGHNKIRLHKNLTTKNKNIRIVIDTEGDHQIAKENSVISVSCTPIKDKVIVLDDTVNKENAPAGKNIGKTQRKNSKTKTKRKLSFDDVTPKKKNKSITGHDKTRLHKNLTNKNKNIRIVIDTEGDHQIAKENSVTSVSCTPIKEKVIVSEDTVNKENAPNKNIGKKQRKNSKAKTKRNLSFDDVTTKKKNIKESVLNTPKKDQSKTKKKNKKAKSVSPESNINLNVSLPDSSLKAKSAKKKTRRLKKGKKLLDKMEQETKDESVSFVSLSKTNKNTKQKLNKADYTSHNRSGSFSTPSTSKSPKKKTKKKALNNSSPPNQAVKENSAVLKKMKALTEENRKIKKKLNKLEKMLNQRSARKQKPPKTDFV